MLFNNRYNIIKSLFIVTLGGQTLFTQDQCVVKEQLFHLSVKAIIKNAQGDVLLLRRLHETKWDLPGGRINNNEQPEDALSREIKEETGIAHLEQIQMHNIELTSVTVVPEGVGHESIKLLVLYYTCFASTTDIVLSDEHVEYAWMPWYSARAKIAPLGQSAYIDQFVCAWIGHQGGSFDTFQLS